MMRYLIFVFLILLYSISPARAACSDPVAHAGEVTFSTDANVPIYCDGTYWIGMAGADVNTLDYKPNAVAFDGTNDFLDGVGNIAPESKVWSGSFWVKLSSINGAVFGDMFFNGATRGMITVSSNGSMLFGGYNNAGTPIMNITTQVNSLTVGNWHHVLFSFDLSDTANRHVYIDDTPATLSISNYIDDLFDHDIYEVSVGSSTNGGSKIHGDLSDFWMDFGTYIDLSVEANRRKFITASGNPAYLGENGELPTGSAPDIFFSGATDSWHTNKGTGGGFTENGALTTAATVPYTPVTQIVPTGLVGHWRLDETSGTNVIDSTGNGYDGTMTGAMDAGTDNADGVVSGSLQFNEPDYITMGDVLDNYTDFTISAWVYTDGWDTVNKVDTVLGKEGIPTTTNSSYVLRIGDVNKPTNLIQWVTRQSDGTQSAINSNSLLEEKKWYHLTVIHSSSGYKAIYINGVLDAENASASDGTILDSAIDFRIGSTLGVDRVWNGRIDDVRFYNRVLGEDEIQEIYEARDGIRYNGNERKMEYFDGNRWVSMTSAWPEPDPDPYFSAYAPNAVEFDGAGDELEDATGGGSFVDGQQFTASLWFKPDYSENQTTHLLFNLQRGGLQGCLIRGISGAQRGRLDCTFGDNSSTTVFDIDIASQVFLDESKWYHLMFSFDTSDYSKWHIYIDGTDASGLVSYPLGSYPFTLGSVLWLDNPTERYIGGRDGNPATSFTGYMADIWLADEYIDLSVQANREKFIDASGNPVNLGADGSLPTGSAPDIFLSGDTADWHTNKGTGGGFTENGELTTAHSRPGTPDYQGLVGHWKLDETSGTVAYDSSGYGNDGAMQGGLSATNDSVAGAVGTTLSFDGIDDYFTVPAGTQPTGDFTYAMWIKLNDLTTSNILSGFYGNGGEENELLLQIDTLGRVRFNLNNVNVANSSAAINAVEWAHIAMVRNGSAVQLYVNGAPDGSGTDGTALSAVCPIIIGSEPDAGCTSNIDGFIRGAIDDYRIYDRALTATEIQTLYNMGAPVGSNTALPQGCPTIGDICDDGTIYAGLSPDGSVEMFAAPEDAPTGLPFNNGNTSGYVDTTTPDMDTGAANTQLLVTLDSDSVTAGFQPHQAAQYCYDLVSNGADDWYLPATNELRLLYDNLVDQDGDFVPGGPLGSTYNFNTSGAFVSGVYWDSREWGGSSDHAGFIRFSDGHGAAYYASKHLAASVRCVRKGPAPRCANPYGIEGAMVYNTSDNVLQYCDGARWIAIGKSAP